MHGWSSFEEISFDPMNCFYFEIVMSPQISPMEFFFCEIGGLYSVSPVNL